MTLDEALWQDPARCSGAVCFRDTRIMVSILFDSLNYPGGYELFLENYPDVPPEKIQAVLDFAQNALDLRFAQPVAA